MFRFTLSALVALVLVAPVSAQTPFLTVNLASLGLDQIHNIRPVELDGQPGTEYLVQVGPVFFTRWVVLYPQRPGGLCNAGEIALSAITDTIADTDGDGKQEIVRFDVATQTVIFMTIPAC